MEELWEPNKKAHTSQTSFKAIFHESINSF